MFYKITNGSVMRGSETVLEQVNFEIRDKEKIAIVGRNGCGKTTLLKAVLGEVEMEAGAGEEEFSVTHSGNPVIGYLRQTDFPDETVSMETEVYSVFGRLLQIEADMKVLEEKMAVETNEEKIQMYTTLHEQYDFLGGYTYKKEAETVIKKFGFTEEDKQKPLCEFSGGQRTKIAFMKLLLSKPDILLLDEPTNHLDIETIRWLEDYLQRYHSAVVVVSHDRMFLDKVVSVVYEIEYGETTRYTGNYASFEKLKREQYEKQRHDYAAQQAEIARLNRLIERFRYKATKAAMAQSKLKQIERMAKVDAPDRYDLRTFHAEFQPEEQSVKKVLSVDDLSIGYDRPLGKFSFELLKGQKLGIVGKNGIGKSTFLKTLMRQIQPMSGSFEFGVRVKIGYFDQQIALQGSNKSVLDTFCDAFPKLTMTEARTSLGAFQFCGDDVYKTVDSLSGGERVRLSLCQILKRRPNVLILDEPTNHMDIVGKETLENMLQAFEGTIIFVTHDRYFVQKIADCLLVFEDNEKVDFYPFGYSEYEEKIREKDDEIPQNSASVKTTEKPSKKSFSTPLKDLNRLKKQVEKAEKEMTKIEEQIRILEGESMKPEIVSDYVRLSEIGKQLDELKQQEDEQMTLWECASEELTKLLKKSSILGPDQKDSSM